MKLDMAHGKLIGSPNSFSQEFHYVEPRVFVNILNIYAASFYGSSLWDLFSSDCERIFAAWNVAIRICFQVDRTTHRYFIEELSESMHPKVMMCSRYAGFHQTLLKCDKFSVRYLARLHEQDMRTVFGRTLRQIASECGGDFPVQKEDVKKKMKYFAVPDHEVWRCSLVKELLKVRDNTSTLSDFSRAEVDDMLKFVCTS